MEIIIKISPKIPEKGELQNLIDYLMDTFPLTNHGKFSVTIEKTKNMNIKANCGNLCGYQFQDGSRLTRITIKLPKVYTLKNALFTLAHEYCHTLQQLWEVGLYRISKPACAEEFDYVHVK